MQKRADYDPFGEPIQGLATSVEGDRRARRAALAVFWAAALLLTASRIYVGHIAPASATDGPQVLASAAP